MSMTLMSKCGRCECLFDPSEVENGMCLGCRDLAKFAAFAAECGLTMFPTPDGERYLYDVDGECAGKKSEHSGYCDELWNALCRLKGREDLKIGG